MATPFMHLLVAVASLATVYSVVATSANAWADDINAVARAPAELLQWHSGLTDTVGSCVEPAWNSTVTAIDPRDFTVYLEMHGAIGLRVTAEGEFESSLSFFDVPKGARKSAGDPPGPQAGSVGRLR